jgi:hypothetical protein
MNDTPDNTDQPDARRLLDFEEKCPDCGVAVGEEHLYNEVNGGCDVARCQVNGRQRLMCELDDHDDCGHDVWTGWWPGQIDCEQLGWMIGPGLPDLNRLYTEAVWDRERCHWVKPI